MWESRPRAPGYATRNPKRLRDIATDMLKKGRLHPDHWCEVDDLLLDDRLDEAAEVMQQHITAEPAFPVVPGPRGTEHAA
jgi:hypothetical protein